jgi:hypothetical protein
MHEHGHFSGMSIYKYADDIDALIKRSKVRTLLDYGSGKGRQYEEGRLHMLWGIMPRMYDPAVKAIRKRPEGQFDGVICTDVMEHIPEEEVIETLEDIKQYARKWCFISICCRPAKKTLPDGRNVHVTIQEESWWLERIAEVFSGSPEPHVRFERPGDKGKPRTVKKKGKPARERANWAKKDPSVCVVCGALWIDKQTHCPGCGGHFTQGRAKGAAPKAWIVEEDGTWTPKPTLLKYLK